MSYEAILIGTLNHKVQLAAGLWQMLLCELQADAKTRHGDDQM
jgi:hypothetical protein